MLDRRLALLACVIVAAWCCVSYASDDSQPDNRPNLIDGEWRLFSQTDYFSRTDGYRIVFDRDGTLQCESPLLLESWQLNENWTLDLASTTELAHMRFSYDLDVAVFVSHPEVGTTIVIGQKGFNFAAFVLTSSTSPQARASLSQWWLFCGMLVFLMQIGFMMFEAGCVRDINRSGIAFKNLMMLLVSILGFTVLGYKLTYGSSLLGVIGSVSTPGEKMGHGLSWQFAQTGYAIIAATIISGAIAGRSQLRANVIAALAMTAVMYPMIAHWAWGGGWLQQYFNVHDFAGSGAVHLVGGTAAAMGAWVVGPRFLRSYRPERKGPRPRKWLTTGEFAKHFGIKPSTVRKWIKDGMPGARKNVRPARWLIQPQIAAPWVAGNEPGVSLEIEFPIIKYTTYRLMKNAPQLPRREFTFASYGVVLMMIGWMGFNGGNIEGLDEFRYGMNGRMDALGAYFLATCCAGVGGMLIVSAIDGVRSFQRTEKAAIDWWHALTGTMGGMVAVTAVCDILPTVYHAFGAGVLGGLATHVCSRIVQRLGLDDPVDAIAVHAGGGVIGVLLATCSSEATLGGQLVYIAMTGAVTGFLSLMLFLTLDDWGWLRCGFKEEWNGLNWGVDQRRRVLPDQRQTLRRLRALFAKTPTLRRYGALLDRLPPPRRISKLISGRPLPDAIEMNKALLHDREKLPPKIGWYPDARKFSKRARRIILWIIAAVTILSQIPWIVGLFSAIRYKFLQ